MQECGTVWQCKFSAGKNIWDRKRGYSLIAYCLNPMTDNCVLVRPEHPCSFLGLSHRPMHHRSPQYECISQVYDAIWSTIIENESTCLAQYRETASEVQIHIKLTETGGVLCQRHKKCVPLLQDAAQIKPLFDKLINTLLNTAREQFKMRGQKLNIVEIKIPEHLKRVARILEKAAFRCDDIDNCDNTCDIG